MESKYDENFPDGPIYYPAKIAIIAEEKVKNGDLNEARYILRELDVENEWEGEYDEENAFGQANMTTNGVELTRMETSTGSVPNVKGMGAKDAVYLMEKCGLKVQLSGIGKVRSQSIPAGTKPIKGRTVKLVLK